jgi:hypothetical protein
LRARAKSAPAWPFVLATLALSATAFAVTATTLGRENFWLDELSSLYFSDPARSFHDTVRTFWQGETNPPLYYLYLYLWRHLVPGTDEMSIRMGSLIPAALACLSPLVYSSRIMRLERRLAVVLLLSFSPGLLYYAGEARGYTLLLMFSVNMCFLLLSVLERLRTGGGLAGRLVLLSMVSVAAAWTHLFGALLAGVFFLTLIAASIVLRRRMRPVAFAAAITAVAVALWPLAHLAYMNAVASDHWFIPLTRESVITETKWIGHLAFGDRIGILAFGAATLAALAYAWRPRHSGNTAFYMSLPLFVGLVIALSLAVPIYYARYFVILLPAIYLLVADAIGEATDRLGAPAWLPFGIILVMAPLLITGWPVLKTPEREDWRAQANAVNSTQACTGAPILTVAPGRDSGDPAYLYGHYLDPARDVKLIAVRANAELDPELVRRVWRSPCPIKIWGAHIEAWQLRALANQFVELPAGFSLLPFRNGFLLVADSSEELARESARPAR